MALVSPNYVARQFPQAELGAAVVGLIKGECRFNSFVVPPFEFGDQEGVLYGVQSGSIVDPAALDDLRKPICGDCIRRPA